MIASLPCMQWLTTPIPRRPGRPGDRLDAGDLVLPLEPEAGRRQVVPDEGRRGVEDLRIDPCRIRSLDDVANPTELGRPGSLQVAQPGHDLADALEVLAVLDEARPRPGRRGPSPRRRRRCTSRRRRSRSSSRTWFFSSRWTTMTSLPTSSSHDADPLADDLPVVGDDLQVEVRDEDAGVALAARRLADVAEPAAEGEVAPLDDVLELRPVHRLGDRIDEGRVTLELGELEGRPEGAHDRPDQVGQDVLRMVELGAGEEAGVAGDVGDDEAGGLWLVEHRWGVPRAAIHHRPFAGPCHGPGTPGFAAGPPPDQTRADVALRRHLLAIRR